MVHIVSRAFCGAHCTLHMPKYSTLLATFIGDIITAVPKQTAVGITVAIVVTKRRALAGWTTTAAGVPNHNT